jgi:large subunit ribosomal protein L7/L12
MELVDVVIVDAGRSRSDVIRAIRDVTAKEPVVRQMDLREAMRRVDTAPCVVVPNVPLDAGERIKASLEDAGATIELRPS